MKLSARNALPGKIEQVHKGVTTTIVKVDIGNGLNVTASITNVPTVVRGRQRSWADSISLNAMAIPAALEPGPW